MFSNAALVMGLSTRYRIKPRRTCRSSTPTKMAAHGRIDLGDPLAATLQFMAVFTTAINPAASTIHRRMLCATRMLGYSITSVDHRRVEVSQSNLRCGNRGCVSHFLSPQMCVICRFLLVVAAHRTPYFILSCKCYEKNWNPLWPGAQFTARLC